MSSLDPIFREKARALQDKATAHMDKLAFESRVPSERAVAHVALNRRLGREMPVEKEDRALALDVMEWAHGPDAAAVAPEDVAAYRAFCKNHFVDDAHWRTAFDMALGIWKQGHDDHLRKRAAF